MKHLNSFQTFNEKSLYKQVSDLEQKIWASEDKKAIDSWDDEAEEVLGSADAKYWKDVDDNSLHPLIDFGNKILSKIEKSSK